MSGRGERPEEDDGEEQAEETAESVAVGEKIYNGQGEFLGRVRGYEEGGFFMTTRDGMERLSLEHARSGHDFGEPHLMWRCVECGEMGEIDDVLPGTALTVDGAKNTSSTGKRIDRNCSSESRSPRAR